MLWVCLVFLMVLVSVCIWVLRFGVGVLVMVGVINVRFVMCLGWVSVKLMVNCLFCE